jgi:hypothetical protein
MFISEVQNKNALQRTLMSHRTMTDSAQWPVGAVSGCKRHTVWTRLRVRLYLFYYKLAF